MIALKEKLEEYDNQIKLKPKYPNTIIGRLANDVDRLEKLIYFLAEELSKK